MKLSYRPEIDGLRAIAVCAVILYHAQINIFGHQTFNGGFFGVDIFFVISGYLITSIILNELVATGSFSFKHFYERRIRRILPALLVVMLICLPFAWVYLLPYSFINFSKSMLYSLGFSSNFSFHYSGQTYGAEIALLNPFLHTWSLSVEEQYYILFPIVLLVSFKYFRKYLIHILLIGFVVSLGLADWGSRNHPSFNFYVLPTRGWELLAGSILSYFEITLKNRNKYIVLNKVLPAIGIILITHSIFFFNDKIFHPSLITLFPIMGVCLIIWFSHKDEFITKILSSKLFVGIGLISYSLYLWHFPIFAFARLTENFEGDLFKKLLFGLLTIILSVTSYYFIERPFRNKKNKFTVIINPIIIFISILIIFSFISIQKKGFQNRVPEILKNDYTEYPWVLLKDSNGDSCINKIEGCKFNTSSNQKVYLIGDSHMASIMFNLKNEIIKKQYQFISLTNDCGVYYPGFNMVNTKTNKIHKRCNDKYFQNIKKILLKEKNSILIFGGRFPVNLSNYKFDNQEGGVEGGELLDKYISVGKYDTIQNSFKNEILELSIYNKIILVYPIPEIGWNPNMKIHTQWINSNFSNNFVLENITTSYQVYLDRAKSSFELLDSIKNDNIHRVYPHKLFCDLIIKGRCVTHNDKYIFYSDDDHPSWKGAEMINKLIIKEIEEIRF